MGDYQWRYSRSEEHLEGIAVRCESKQFARPHISFFDWRNEVLQEQRFTKRDWALFRSKIGSWQEAYMGRLCDEYIGSTPQPQTARDSSERDGNMV